ncbi:MAG: N-acetyltransferase [Clostridia bacterium]|nr:N-acetyltransferase [Clostridia bacterium]
MEFPVKLYRDCPYYVPDILASQVEDMMPEKNPAFEYAEAACFSAFRDGKQVGRIAAIHNRRANEKFGKNYLTVTHIDFIDDDEVVDALFDAAEAWGRVRGCTHSHGPLGFSDMDREGMLVEGFDRLSLFITYYNHPYYVKQMERRGYGKEIDWIEMRVEIPEQIPERIGRIADWVRDRMHLRVVNLGEKPVRTLAKDMFKLWNDTYRVLFGVVPMTEKQVRKYVNEFLPLIDRRTTAFVYNDKDEMVAFGIACPALEEAQRKNGGKMFPFGWIPMLKALKGKNDTIDLLLIAVRPDLQAAGVNAVIMREMHKVYRYGFRYAETGPMLETNEKVHALWKYFPHEQHKRRRCWVKEL